MCPPIFHLEHFIDKPFANKCIINAGVQQKTLVSDIFHKVIFSCTYAGNSLWQNAFLRWTVTLPA